MRAVMASLSELQKISDPVSLAAQLGRPISPSCEITLTNPHPDGKNKTEQRVLLNDIQKILSYVTYRSIPFDHSAHVLDYYLNLFYPTDNTHINDDLGYYRQREWRLISSGIGIKGRQVSRPLSPAEIVDLENVDPRFWSREITRDGKNYRRSELARLYDPKPDWNLFEAIEAIVAPEIAVSTVRSIVGEGVTIYLLPHTDAKEYAASPHEQR